MSTIRISVTDLRARFAEACTEAEQGKEVIITKHGFPYMQLVPLATELHQKPAKLEEPDATA